MVAIYWQRKNGRSGNSQQGYTIVELIIATALGILLSWAILDITLSATGTAREVELTSEMVENGRYLSHFLKSEIRLAGFYGRLENYSSGATVQPNPCTDLTTTNLIDGLSFPLFGLDEVAAGATTCNGDRLLTGTDILLVRRASTSSVATTVGLAAKQQYLQATVTAMVLDTGANKANFTLMEKDSLGLAPIREYYQNIYYVDNSNTFKRLRLINGAYISEPLAEGVDDFQVVYGIDRSGNGIPNGDGTSDAFVELPASAAEWQNVVSLKLFLIVSSTNPAPGLNDPKAYTYADKVNVTFGDSKKRRLFTVVARLTNISIKRAGL
ncbi:MAG: PilW family protein [Porticoccaceae bacterium]|nr:PilW family protein [Porticoccaceae bacterium]